MDKKAIKNWLTMPNWNGKSSFDLENIKKILEILGNPQDKPKSVHIAGTNGKGSVTTAIGKMLLLSGYKVGVLTSPHLIKVNERININGNDISDEELDYYLKETFGCVEKSGIELSKHEVITVASFLACQKLDWIVVEVGLGGRLDASNTLTKPELAIITTIDYDHTAILGDTLDKIAKEKGGIIKNKEKVILGNITGFAKDELLKIVKEKNSKVYVFGEDFSYYKNNSEEYFYNGLTYRDLRLKLRLLGRHQLDNMSVALTAGLLLGLEPKTCLEAIKQCNIPCRLEKFCINGAKILLDSAHNPAGVKTLISFLESKKGKEEQYKTILFGVFADKNWQSMLDLMIPVFVNWNIILAPDARGLQPEIIKEYMESREVGEERLVIWNKLEDALESLCSNKENFVVAGSMSLVGEARKFLIGKTSL